MSFLVDTSVWSLAFRRGRQEAESHTYFLYNLISQRQAIMCGAVRQEILSGISSHDQFLTLKEKLRAFPDLMTSTADYEKAAEISNVCRRKGIQGSHTDFLLCALAVNYNLTLLTTDTDFLHISSATALKLHLLKLTD